ncbi:MAG: ABC transporter substrate-binding protein [Acidimicrobiales bacterium]
MRNRIRAISAIAVLGVAATACSGGSGKSSGGNAPTVGSSSATPTSLAPKPGGKLVVGLEAETDGFDPTKNRWAISAYEEASAVMDPLTVLGKDGKAHPYLAEAVTPNSDYTVWTIKLRPNIKFSDGDPLTADAVVTDLQAHQKSSLTGSAISNIDTISKTDDLTVTVKCKTPWVPFPTYLAGQIGYIFSPKMLTAADGSAHPVGTGPFILKEWVPGNHFIATKNPNYWQKDKGLPYLESVEFRPIIETQSRDNSLTAGTIDITQSSDPQMSQDLKGASGINLETDIENPGRNELSFIQLNTASPPLDDVTLRTALAYATDRKKYRDVIDFGVTHDATGPFTHKSDWAGPTGYPDFDLNKAKELVKEYTAKHGGVAPSFELGTTNSGRSLQGASLIQDMWKQAGITVSIKQVEQSQYILQALLGKLQAYAWRQFGEPDPDADVVWWSSQTANDIGKLSLNFARNKDPQVDADLQKGRSSPNDADRKAAYQDIAKQFAKDIPYLWISETAWQVASKKNVHGLGGYSLPDGAPYVDHPRGGFFFTSQLWVN